MIDADDLYQRMTNSLLASVAAFREGDFNRAASILAQHLMEGDRLEAELRILKGGVRPDELPDIDEMFG